MKKFKDNKGFTFFREVRNKGVYVFPKEKGKPLVKIALANAKANKGFTLTEVLIYSAILAIISLVVLVFINQLLGVNETTRRARESTDNARRSIDTIAQEVRHAESVYTPTSSFGSSPGQLSLETTRDVPANEETTYVDFYVDNQQLFVKREGQNAQLLTSEKVRVTSLTFTNLVGATTWPAVRISLTVEYRDPINGPKNQVTMTTTAVLRSL
jgi:prepilin-type N-terminal cleavage/methylation domain-containing protein